MVDVTYDNEAEPRTFDVQVHLPEGLDADQVKRLTRVAETCPVRKAREACFAFEGEVLTDAAFAG